jgi:hypothetical protein
MTHSKGHQVNVKKTLCAASRVELTIVTALSHAACQGSVEHYRMEKSMHPENSHCHAFEPRQSIHRAPQSINTTVQNKGSAKWHQDFAFSLHSTCCAKKITEHLNQAGFCTTP